MEKAIIKELASIRLPSPRFRPGLGKLWMQRSLMSPDSVLQQKKALTKRRTELANMQERLFNAYLAGTIDEAAFQAKSEEMKRDAANVERQLADVESIDESARELALSVFDFSQNLVNLWNGSNYERKREILECVSSNRVLGPLSLYLEKRKPFDILAKGLSLKDGRGDWIRTSDLMNPIHAR